ncbi:hypothetical protein [Streptomyces sp. UG1]|uniref:hypothetical protein n=1 Tax=Streptomyces sp. UG1 TaxID=3417652 RepID=UPI003CED1A06
MLTVLDVIGQHRREFRLEKQFQVTTNVTRNQLQDHIERDLPRLPSGFMTP